MPLENVLSVNYERIEGSTFKLQPKKIFKRTQAIRWQQPTKCLSVFDHFVVLALKGLITN